MLSVFRMFILLIAISGAIASYAQCPSVTTISPASGPANTVVTITGANFQSGSGITSVKFNGVDAASFMVVSNTEVTAVVPATAANGAISLVSGGCPAATGGSFTLMGSNCTPPAAGDVYISELYDHNPGSYGVIELYNPTDNTIAFGGQYVLERYGDINDTDPTPGYILTLPGSIAPHSTYLVSSYGSGVQGCTVTTVANLGGGINGNDEFKLRKNGSVIDIARAPVNAWYTVIRNPDAAAPSAAYSASDWTITSNFTCSNLGTHNANITNPPTIVTQPQDNGDTCENGFAMLTVALDDPTGFSYQWKMLNSSGNWVNVTNGGNYSDATTPMLIIDPVPYSFNGNQYYCEITAPGCTLLSNAVELTVLPSPVVTTLVTSNCTLGTATLTITPVLGTGLTYKLDSGPFQASPIFTGLTPGTHTLTIQSSPGNCTSTITVTVDPITGAPAVATFTQVQPTCTVPTGTINVTGPSETGMTYSIDGVNFGTATSFAGLLPGTYTITIKNAAGCTSVTGNITINTVPNAPAVADVTVTQPDCTVPTGTITVNTPTGMTYSIDGVNFGTATSFTGLLPGTYTITVKNAAGCTSVTGNITINAVPNAPAVADVTVTQPDCAVPTGTITVNTPTGMTYSIDGVNFGTATTFSGLLPGNYTITVKNAAGCTSVTGNITINTVPNAPAVADVTVTQPDCAVPTGTITVNTPTGMTYSIDGVNFGTTTSFAGLVPGNYTITVKNAQGCTSVTGNITINAVPNAPAVADVTVTQPTCTVPTGTIAVNTPTGMTYSIDGVNFGTATSFAGLVPGNYTITVKNAAGCTSITGNIIINTVPNAPAPATVSIIQPTCADPSGTILITNPAGGLTYSLDGVNFQGNPDFAGLVPGTYAVTVKNADGCTSVSINHIVDPAPNGPAIPTVSVIQPTCAVPAGTITVTNAAPGITYSVDGVNFQAGTSFAGLTPGTTYTLVAKNPDGCTALSPLVSLNVIPAGPQTTGTQGCRDTLFGSNYVLEALPLNNSFDVATANFEWRNESGIVVGNNDNTFNATQYVTDNNIVAEDYPLQISVTVTTEAGCQATYSFTVENAFCSIPRGISPNNDAMNDNFDITGLNANKIAIFNRYGQEVYAKSDYTNQWYGQADNGDELPTGTYYYMIETTGESFTGWVYINRQEN